MSTASGGGQEVPVYKDDICEPLVVEPNTYGAGNPGAYAMVAVLQAGLALPAYLSPHGTAEVLFGATALPHIALHEPLMRLLALGLAAGAWGALGLMGAAERQDLNKRVFQRLNLSMLTLAGGLAALEALHLSALTPGGAAIGAMASLPALLVAGVHYQRTSGHGLNPLPVLTGAAKSMGQLVNNKTSSARLYSLLTAAIAGAGAAYMFLPDTSLSVLAQRTCSGLCGGQPLGPDVMAVFGSPGTLGWVPGREDAVVLWRMIGGALLALTPWTYSLKGAADCDLLWRRPFPLLNAGLTLVAAGHLFVLSPLLVNGMGGNLLPAVVGTWGLALATASYNWLKNIGK